MKKKTKRLFGLGLGLFLAVVAYAGTDPSNVFKLGDGTPSNKKFIANTGQGVTNPQIIWNNAAANWQFSNDGSNFQNFGSGSGGGSAGINLLNNPGFEAGVTLGWANSGGTFSAVSGGSNLLVGVGSALFTPNNTNQFVHSTLYPVPNGLKGNGCVGSMLYLGGSSNLTFIVSDGTNMLATQQLAAVSTPTTVNLPFLCPSSGSVELVVMSSAASAAIAMDQMFLGQTQTNQVSQSQLVGQVTISGCANPWVANTSTATLPGAQANCVYTTSGNIAAPTAGEPGFTIPNAPPGVYRVVFSGLAQMVNTNSSGNAFYALCSGSNATCASSGAPSAWNSAAATLADVQQTASAANGGASSLEWAWEQNSAATNLELDVYAGRTSATASAELYGSNIIPGTFQVYYFPSQTLTAVNVNLSNWLVDFNVGNPSAANYTPAVSFTPITDSGLVGSKGNQDGAYTVGMACQGNPSTGNTCALGSPEMGVVVNIPTTGLVEVCSDFNITIAAAATSSSNDLFQMNMTAPASDIPVQTAVDVTSTLMSTGTAALNTNNSFHVCDVFKIPAVGTYEFKMFYTAANTGTVSQNSLFGSHWVVRPYTQNVPTPVLVNSVISSFPGVTKVESASGACVGSPTVNQYGNWISSIVHNSTGNCTLNFTASHFANPPNCTITAFFASSAQAQTWQQTVASTASAITIQAMINTTPSDADYIITCVGN